MADYRGFQAIVTAVNDLNQTVKIESNSSLMIARAIRENVRSFDRAIQARLDASLTIDRAIRAEVRANLSISNRINKNIERLNDNLKPTQSRPTTVIISDSIGLTIAKKVGQEIRAKPLKVEIQQSVLKTIGEGFLSMGIGGGIGLKLIDGFDKALKKNIGFNIKSTGYGLGNVATNPKQAARDAIKTRREWQSKNEGLRKALELADQETPDKIQKDKLNIFTVGGLADEEGRSGAYVAKSLKDHLGRKNVNVIPVSNKESDVSLSEKEIESLKKVFNPKNEDELSGLVDNALNYKRYGTFLNQSLIQGYNQDSVNLAAKVIKAKRNNPDAKIKLAGYSDGGRVVEEALKIIENAGIKGVEGIGIGTADLGIGFNSKKYQGFFGEKDRIATENAFMRFLRPTREKLSNNQTIKNRKYADLSGHELEQYLKTPEVNLKGLKGELTGLTRKIEEFIKEILFNLNDLDLPDNIPENLKGPIEQQITQTVEAIKGEIADKLEMATANQLSPEISKKLQELLEIVEDTLADNIDKIRQKVVKEPKKKPKRYNKKITNKQFKNDEPSTKLP